MPAPSAPLAAQPLLDGQGQPNSSGDAYHVIQMNGGNGGSGGGGPSSRTRRQALGSAVCMAILAIVLLLTFLIPRSPSVALSGGAVGLSGAPIYVNASFELHNRNWYSTTFKDLRFGLYTLSDTGIGQIGTAFYPGPIHVKARRRQTIQVGIQTARGTGLSIKQYCSEHPSILMFLANATIYAECDKKSFGTMGVYTPYGALFMCPPPPTPPPPAQLQQLPVAAEAEEVVEQEVEEDP